jgi:F-type H+-transporting ATPase subunit delta
MSLFEATHGKAVKEVKAELENFVRILSANGDISRSEAILSEFEKVWQTEKGVAMAEVVSADKLEAKTLDQLKAYIAAETGATEVQLAHEVDESLLAGFVLRFNDQILDGSAKNMVKNLKKELIK